MSVIANFLFDFVIDTQISLEIKKIIYLNCKQFSGRIKRVPNPHCDRSLEACIYVGHVLIQVLWRYNTSAISEIIHFIWFFSKIFEKKNWGPSPYTLWFWVKCFSGEVSILQYFFGSSVREIAALLFVTQLYNISRKCSDLLLDSLCQSFIIQWN